MGSISNNKPKPAATAVNPWSESYSPNRSVMRRVQTEPLIWAVVVSVLLSLFLVVLFAKPVWSQGVQLVKVDVAVVAKGHRVSQLTGSSVTNEKNEKIGTIDDFVIARNRSLFAVLQVGGFLGIGGHLVAVPYDSLVIDDEGTKIQLPGASKDELKKLTEFKYRG